MTGWIAGLMVALPLAVRADMARIDGDTGYRILGALAWVFILPWVVFGYLYQKAGRGILLSALFGLLTTFGLHAAWYLLFFAFLFGHTPSRLAYNVCVSIVTLGLPWTLFTLFLRKIKGWRGARAVGIGFLWTLLFLGLLAVGFYPLISA